MNITIGVFDILDIEAMHVYKELKVAVQMFKLILDFWHPDHFYLIRYTPKSWNFGVSSPLDVAHSFDKHVADVGVSGDYVQVQGPRCTCDMVLSC